MYCVPSFRFWHLLVTKSVATARFCEFSNSPCHDLLAIYVSCVEHASAASPCARWKPVPVPGTPSVLVTVCGNNGIFNSQSSFRTSLSAYGFCTCGKKMECILWSVQWHFLGIDTQQRFRSTSLKNKQTSLSKTHHNNNKCHNKKQSTRNKLDARQNKAFRKQTSGLHPNRTTSDRIKSCCLLDFCGSTVAHVHPAGSLVLIVLFQSMPLRARLLSHHSNNHSACARRRYRCVLSFAS